MNRRLDIINSFKSVIDVKKKPLTRKINSIKMWLIFYASIMLFCITITTNSILFATNSLKWEKMTLLIIFGLLYIIQSKSLLYEYLLLKHANKLQAKRITETDTQLDRDLLQLINYFNKNKKDVFTLGLAMVIGLAGMINMFSEGKFAYWDFSQIPFLLLVTYLLGNTLYGFLKLRKNISETEKLVFAQTQG